MGVKLTMRCFNSILKSNFTTLFVTGSQGVAGNTHKIYQYFSLAQTLFLINQSIII